MSAEQTQTRRTLTQESEVAVAAAAVARVGSQTLALTSRLREVLPRLTWEERQDLGGAIGDTAALLEKLAGMLNDPLEG